MFLAGSLEYIGPVFATVAGIFAACTVIGTLVLLALIVPMFKRSSLDALLLSSGCIAGLPFLVWWLLELCGTPLNVHGASILGWATYFLGSIIGALGLLVAAMVRKIRS